MNCHAINFLRQLAPSGLLPHERQAWMDGLLCASVLFDTEAEREIEADYHDGPEYRFYLAGRAKGAEFNQPTPEVQ